MCLGRVTDFKGTTLKIPSELWKTLNQYDHKINQVHEFSSCNRNVAISGSLLSGL